MANNAPQQHDLQAKLAGLRDECAAAPRYGVNGRMLILQAARMLAQQEASHTVPRAAPPAAAPLRLRAPAPAPARLDPTKLSSLVAVQERPQVPYVARSFLTNLQRQEVAVRLHGGFLVLLMRQLQVGSMQRAQQVVTSDPLVRKAAAAASLAQEHALYRAVTSKDAYTKRARILEAELAHVPADLLAQLRCSYLQLPAKQLLPQDADVDERCAKRQCVAEVGAAGSDRRGVGGTAPEGLHSELLGELFGDDDDDGGSNGEGIDGGGTGGACARGSGGAASGGSDCGGGSHGHGAGGGGDELAGARVVGGSGNGGSTHGSKGTGGDGVSASGGGGNDGEDGGGGTASGASGIAVRQQLHGEDNSDLGDSRPAAAIQAGAPPPGALDSRGACHNPGPCSSGSQAAGTAATRGAGVPRLVGSTVGSAREGGLERGGSLGAGELMGRGSTLEAAQGCGQPELEAAAGARSSGGGGGAEAGGGRRADTRAAAGGGGGGAEAGGAAAVSDAHDGGTGEGSGAGAAAGAGERAGAQPAAPAEGTSGGVRPQVEAFVASMLAPLLKSGGIGRALAAAVAAKAVDKILSHHMGATDAGFLVHECGAISKLVSSYVDYFKRREEADEAV